MVQMVAGAGIYTFPGEPARRLASSFGRFADPPLKIVPDCYSSPERLKLWCLRADQYENGIISDLI